MTSVKTCAHQKIRPLNISFSWWTKYIFIKRDNVVNTHTHTALMCVDSNTAIGYIFINMSVLLIILTTKPEYIWITSFPLSGI